MKAMPIESIIRNIGRLNPVIELKPGQIYSGKVLAMYPNDLAKVQLAGQKMNAQLLTGLSRNENYWLQVKSSTSGGLPVLEVIEQSKANQFPAQIVGNRKIQPALQRMIINLSDEQLPITKELITRAEKWLSQVPSIDKGIQAVKTMLIKNLPVTEAIFKALYHVQDSGSLTSELQSLQQNIKGAGAYSGVSAVEKAISRVLDATSRNPAIETFKQLIQLYSLPTTASSSKFQIENIFRTMDMKIPSMIRELHTQSVETKISDEAFLKELKMNMSVPKSELYLQQKLSTIPTEQLNWIHEQVNMNKTQKPYLNLIEIIRGLGLTFEHDLINTQLGQLKNQQQLKSALLELLSQDLPGSIKDRAEVLLHRLTGQQLLYSSENQSITSLFYQFPVHFKEWESDVMMRWDLKKESSGEVDEDFSRILFYLDLEFLKETIVDMNVQNRIISVKIINESEFLESHISELKPQLKNAIEKIDYKLSTVKVENLSEGSTRSFRLQDVSTRGVDLFI
ncbi:hypothetical protein [Bacillus sp. Marseille-Q3570]|uniref:hypothetical protein n=1 Tax=Bacillus sp. Marseille-Q3570 TaxID=2963522 RepID=UPI0021B6F9D7|nr:hypothetical protein [Bacillus sp. Marseille-Q3570]